jgi:glucose-6-phosphate 1-dehydrogenase
LNKLYWLVYLTNAKSTVLIIIWVKKPCRILWRSALLTHCLSRCGTVTYIEHVQISVTEQLGVEERGDYYDGSGALRDMIQNHLLQLLCLVAMETPISFDSDEVRDRKVEVLRAMRRFQGLMMCVIRPCAVSIAKGWMQGKEVPGYREEAKVDPESNTETFAAIKFFVDNWRWQGVPFYLRTGKRLHQSASVITIQFKDVPHRVFPTESSESWQQNS